MLKNGFRILRTFFFIESISALLNEKSSNKLVFPSNFNGYINNFDIIFFSFEQKMIITKYYHKFSDNKHKTNLINFSCCLIQKKLMDNISCLT